MSIAFGGTNKFWPSRLIGNTESINNEDHLYLNSHLMFNVSFKDELWYLQCTDEKAEVESSFVTEKLQCVHWQHAELCLFNSKTFILSITGFQI